MRIFKGKLTELALGTGAILWVALRMLSGSESEDRAADRSAPTPSEAYEALGFWTEQRAYPGTGLPDTGIYSAFEQSKALAEQSEAILHSPDTWKLLGPTNKGGRTISLAVDPRNPNIVYAGAASGGLWRMTVKGTAYAWEYIDTKHPVLGVNAIALDPRDSKVIYIGTGEVYGYGKSIGGLFQRDTRGSYGIGLLKSVDSGVTWTKSIDWTYNQQRGVLAIQVDPKNPDIVFAGTSEGLFRSEDAGGEWTQVHNVLMAVDIAINPADPKNVFVSCGNLGSAGSGIYRSVTGGVAGSFQKLAGGLPGSWGGKALLSLYKATPTTIYADVAGASSTVGIFRSTDNGTTWTSLYTQDIASYQGWFAHYIRVHPTDNNRILAAGVQFYSSTNGGTSFAAKSGMHVDHHCYANDPSNPEVVYFGNDGGVYRSANGGGTFTSMSNGYATVQFYNGFSSSPKDPNLAIGGLQDNSCVIYTGSGAWKGALGGDGTMTAINHQDDNIIYGASQNLSISRSTNRGSSWSNVAPPGTGGTCFVAPYAIAPSNGKVLYAGKTIVYKTVNGGDSWTATNGGAALNGNPALAIGISPQDPNVVYVSTPPGGSRRGSVFASYDGGATFKNVTGTLPDRYYIDLVVAPDNKNTAYVTLSGFGSPHLYRTVDAGATWSDIGKGLPDVPTSAVAVDPANPRIIYAGNDLGVYVSIDFGATWAEWKETMPTAALVYDLSFSISNRKIRAVTHGNGVFERSMLPSDVISGVKPRAREGIRIAAHPQGISFELAKAAVVSLDISDLRGKVVRRLAARAYPAGSHVARWDGKDASGRVVPGGTYLCRFKSGTIEKSLRLAWRKDLMGSAPYQVDRVR